MSAPEAAATTTPVVEANPVEANPVEANPASAAEISKVEEAAAVATEAQQEEVEETPAPAEATPAPIEGEVAPVAPEAPLKEEVKPVKTETPKEERPKSPNPFIKFFASIKDKAKGVPKSPKKKEEADAPVAEDTPKEETVIAEPAVETSRAEEALAADPVKETEATIAAPSTADAKKVEKREEKKEDGVSKPKKRLSSFIPNFRSKSKSEAPASAKVDENPPKIEEPTPVAPLTHPASDSTAAESKPQEATTETTPTVNPVVAAAA